MESVPDEVESFLPEYSWDEIQTHKTPEKGIWVTYDNNVYDITEFVHGHPGGKSSVILPMRILVLFAAICKSVVISEIDV